MVGGRFGGSGMRGLPAPPLMGSAVKRASPHLHTAERGARNFENFVVGFSPTDFLSLPALCLAVKVAEDSGKGSAPMKQSTAVWGCTA